MAAGPDLSAPLVRILSLPPTARTVVQLQWISTNPTDTASLAVLGDDGVLRLVKIEPQTSRVWSEVAVQGKAIISFSVDRRGRYMSSVVSDGTMLLHDLDVSRESNRRVRVDRRRMGEDPDLVLRERSVFSASPSEGASAGASAGAGAGMFAGEATRLAYGLAEAQEGRDAFLEKRDPDWSQFPWHI